jgi:hypothetical protein
MMFEYEITSAELAGFDIEDEYEDGDGAKNMIAGLGEVVFNEAILSAECQLVVVS